MPSSNLLGILWRRGNWSSSTSSDSAVEHTFDQKKSNDSSLQIDLSVSTVILAVSWPSAAESALCCRVLLKLFVSHSINSPSMTPKRNLKACPHLNQIRSTLISDFNPLRMKPDQSTLIQSALQTLTRCDLVQGPLFSRDWPHLL